MYCRSGVRKINIYYNRIIVQSASTVMATSFERGIILIHQYDPSRYLTAKLPGSLNETKNYKFAQQ